MSVPARLVAALLAAALALALLLAGDARPQPEPRTQPQPQPRETLPPRLTHGVAPFVAEAQRAAREQARAAARRAVAHYLRDLQQRDTASAEAWMPTELRRNAADDAARHRLLWEHLAIETFTVEDATVLGTRQAMVHVSWRARLDADAYAERLLAWQRERAVALGIDAAEFDARAETLRRMIAHAARRLQRTIEAEHVRLRLRPSDPDAATHPVEYNEWRVEDTFLPSLDDPGE